MDVALATELARSTREKFHPRDNTAFHKHRKFGVELSPLRAISISMAHNPAAAPRNRSVRIHKDVTNALSNISLRGTRVSALVVGFTSNAAGTAPV
jgi:hypothetical protein